MSRRNVLALVLIGPLLAVSLAFGLVPAVMRLYAEQRGLAGAIDPKLVDLVSVGLNLVLLVALFRLRGLSRGAHLRGRLREAHERREESE